MNRLLIEIITDTLIERDIIFCHLQITEEWLPGCELERSWTMKVGERVPGAMKYLEQHWPFDTDGLEEPQVDYRIWIGSDAQASGSFSGKYVG